VRNKLSLAFADLGEQTVKNIAQSVGVFGLAAKDIATLPDEALPEPEPLERRTPLTLRRNSIGAMIAGVVLLLVILASGGRWMLRDKAAPPAASASAPMTPRPAAYSPQDRRLSLIVLPFENSGGDPAQDELAAALTRDVTERIAADTGAPVVLATAAARYRGEPADLRAIGRDHNVHFALMGNARRSDSHLFVSASLYEIDSERTVWSQRYDRADRPDAANAIAQGITTGFEQAAMDAEAARAAREHPNDLDKRDLMNAAFATPLQQIIREAYLARLSLIERALALDPNFVWALRAAGRVRADLVFNGFSTDPAGDLAQALRSVDRALLLAPNDYGTLREKSRVLRAQGDLEGAEWVAHSGMVAFQCAVSECGARSRRLT
jgi:TolB-like protein